MLIEPLIIESWTDWTIRLCPDQRHMGQLEFLVNPRQNGTVATDITELSVEERFGLQLLIRTAKQTVWKLYGPQSFHWIFRTTDDGRCSVVQVPFYGDHRPDRYSHEEIAGQISELMPKVRTGRA